MYARAARLETIALLDTLNTTNKMLARIAILSLIASLAAAGMLRSCRNALSLC